jgi:PhnB protein
MQPIICSILPWLSVRRGARAVEFYKAAFGAIEVYRVEDPTGAVVSRLSVDGAEFWLSDESPAHGNFSPESLGGGSVKMLLTVPDPDGIFKKAVAAGAKEVYAISEGHGWRVGRVADPFGHHWEIGKPLLGSQADGEQVAT